MRRRLFLLTVLIAVAFAPGCDKGSAEVTYPLVSETKAPTGGLRQLRDAKGRRVLLRGVNIRAAPFFDGHFTLMPVPPFSAEDCAVIGDDFGMNLLRLPINWSLIEPERGQFDEAYLDHVLEIAAACSRHGVWTLVDLHQDGWSKYVGDDGAPLWAHEAPGPPADESGGGGSDPTQPDIQAAWDAFFENHDGLQDRYLTLLKHVVRRVSGAEGVIGIEVINEPVSLFDSAPLEAFHRRAALALREVDRRIPFFIEPSAERNLTDNAAVDGPFPTAGAVYAPHLYTGVFLGNWTLDDATRIEDSVVAMMDEAARYDTPLVVTEYGHNPTTETGYAWIGTALDVLDSHLISAAFWVYEEWTPTCDGMAEFSGSCWGWYDTWTSTPDSTDYGRGELRPEAVALLSRPYPRAVAGTLEGFTFDPTSRVLTVDFEPDGTGHPHLLSAPGLVYPMAVAASCDGATVPVDRQGGQAAVVCDGNRLTLAPADESADFVSPYEDALEQLPAGFR